MGVHGNSLKGETKGKGQLAYDGLGAERMRMVGKHGAYYTHPKTAALILEAERGTKKRSLQRICTSRESGYGNPKGLIHPCKISLAGRTAGPSWLA